MVDDGYKEYYRKGEWVAKPCTKGEYLGWSKGEELPKVYNLTDDKYTILSEKELKLPGYSVIKTMGVNNEKEFQQWAEEEWFNEHYAEIETGEGK